MLYNYNGIDKSGKKISGKLESSSVANAKASLKKSGVLVTSINETQDKKNILKFRSPITITCS